MDYLILMCFDRSIHSQKYFDYSGSKVKMLIARSSKQTYDFYKYKLEEVQYLFWFDINWEKIFLIVFDDSRVNYEIIKKKLHRRR